MFESIGRSIELVKESWKIIGKDKEILLFPVISGIACFLVMISFILPLLFAGSRTGEEVSPVIVYGGLFLFYLITYFIVIFCNTGLITCANIRLNGGDPTFHDGISNAFRHVKGIIVWAVISATVGLVLQLLSSKDNIVGQIISSLFGMLWSLITYFVIPVMVLEEKGVGESMKRSAELFRKTWGESVIGQGSIFLIFFLVGCLGLIVVVLTLFSGITFLIIPVVGIYLIGMVILAVVTSALQGVFNTALYLYAKTGSVPSAYRKDLIEDAFKSSNAGFKPGQI